MNIQIHVKVFATLARHLPAATPGSAIEITVPEGTTVASLMEQLRLPTGEVKVVFVNGRARPMDWPLEAGDEVGIFPPVGGG